MRGMHGHIPDHILELTEKAEEPPPTVSPEIDTHVSEERVDFTRRIMRVVGVTQTLASPDGVQTLERKHLPRADCGHPCGNLASLAECSHRECHAVLCASCTFVCVCRKPLCEAHTWLARRGNTTRHLCQQCYTESSMVRRTGFFGLKVLQSLARFVRGNA